MRARAHSDTCALEFDNERIAYRIYVPFINTYFFVVNMRAIDSIPCLDNPLPFLPADKSSLAVLQDSMHRTPIPISEKWYNSRRRPLSFDYIQFRIYIQFNSEIKS